MKKIILSTLFFLLSISGCATKITVKALHPSEIDRAAATKSIAVTEFKNDTIGIGGKFETKIANQQLDNKPYFTVVSRTNINKIIEEQKLQNSGLLDESTSVTLGKLAGAEAIISGEVSNVSKNDRDYFENRIRCVARNSKKECIKNERYKVSCIERSTGFNVNIKMVDVKIGDIIYADSFNKSSLVNHCTDHWGKISSHQQNLAKMIEQVTTKFASKLTPKYVYFKVALLDSPDIDYSDKQKNKFKKAITLMEKKRYNKALKNLEYIVETTAEQSYVALYDLGVAHEALGNLNDAQQLYISADDLIDDSIDEIDSALVRIKDTIAKRDHALKQINRK